jgi:hypothetical protein
MTEFYYQKKEGLIRQKWSPPQKVKSITFRDESDVGGSCVTTVLELEDGTMIKC